MDSTDNTQNGIVNDAKHGDVEGRSSHPDIQVPTISKKRYSQRNYNKEIQPKTNKSKNQTSPINMSTSGRISYSRAAKMMNTPNQNSHKKINLHIKRRHK